MCNWEGFPFGTTTFAKYIMSAVCCIQRISKRKKFTETDNKNSFKGKGKVVWRPGMPMIIKLYKKVKPKDLF